jgi:galactose mutarotase-like enzyme
MPVAFGWHPHLRLPDGDRASWTLVLPAREHLALDDAGIPTGASEHEGKSAEHVGSRTFDDLYALGDTREMSLEHEGTRLTVRFDAGYPFAQVFVPPDGDFACLEPMTAPTNALVTHQCPVVAPGSSYTARFSIAVT